MASSMASHPGGVSSTKTAAEFVGDVDPPGGAGGELFAGDEPVGQPAAHGGGDDTEDLGCFGDGDEFSVGGLGGRLVARDAVVVAEPLHDGGGEALSGGALSALSVQYAGDGGVGVMHGETADQGDGVLVGAGSGLGERRAA